MLRDYVFTIVEIVGVFNTLFVAVALWYLPGNARRANHWLGILFLLFALQFSYAVIRQNDLIYLAPLLTLLRMPLFFLYGPLLYFYLNRISKPWEAPPPLRIWSHLVVFALVALLYLPSLLLSHIELLHLIYYAELRQVYPDIPALNQLQQALLTLTIRIVVPGLVLHLAFYLVLSLRLLHRHQQRVEQHFSRLDKVNLRWMRNLLLALGGICAGVAAGELLFANTTTGYWINAVLQLGLVLFMSALGIFGLLQKSIPLSAPVETAEEQPATADTKYTGSTLTEKLQKEGLAELQTFMKNDKPHLDSELTLLSLSASVGLQPRHLSQIINGSMQQNFVDFINGYRVDEAKRLLKDPSYKGSILDIAMEAGFNSKSAFYSAFKRHTGMTPSDYRQRGIGMDPTPALDRN